MLEALSGVRNRQEFELLVGDQKPRHFLAYRARRDRKMQEVRVLLKHIGFDPRDKRCLDIGPGHGDALDLWHEMGARECAFIENDPWFFAHNRLKPYAHGWELDHLLWIQRLPKAHFDLIYAYGALCSHKRYFMLLGAFGLKNWLRRMKSVAAPEATIILCPYWLCEDGCRLVRHPETHWFTNTLELCGYERQPFVKGYNHAAEYPITWISVNRQFNDFSSE